jgi:hypothetical protein
LQPIQVHTLPVLLHPSRLSRLTRWPYRFWPIHRTWPVVFSLYNVLFRSMQLGGTLFAVCVIQIKPQLEKLLNLPVDSMTKGLCSSSLLSFLVFPSVSKRKGVPGRQVNTAALPTEPRPKPTSSKF